jgi:hypothetical protein
MKRHWVPEAATLTERFLRLVEGLREPIRLEDVDEDAIGDRKKLHPPPADADVLDHVLWVSMRRKLPLPDLVEYLQRMGEQLGTPFPGLGHGGTLEDACRAWAYEVGRARVTQLLRGRGRPPGPSGRKPLSPVAHAKREQLARGELRKHMRVFIKAQERCIARLSRQPPSPDVEHQMQVAQHNLAEAQAILGASLRAHAADWAPGQKIP